MKRYYDIDPLFNQARRLPMEVSIEQVQGFLATSALPAGATKSWFNSLNFYIMLGIITGAIALLFTFSGETNATALKSSEAPELELHSLRSQTSEVQATSAFNPESTPVLSDPHIAVKAGLEVNSKTSSPQKELDQKSEALNYKNDASQETRSSTNASTVNLLLSADSHSEKEDFGSIQSSATVSKQEFVIQKEDTSEEIERILNLANSSSVHITNLKLKRKRNGDVKMLKLAFSIEESNGECNCHTFRTVVLKGFKTYSFGWDVNEDGETQNFWDQLNKKPPSEVPQPKEACGQVKYFCNS